MKFGRKAKVTTILNKSREKQLCRCRSLQGQPHPPREKQQDRYFEIPGLHRSRWIYSFAKMAGLHFGVCQAQKDRQSDSLTQVSGKEVFCEGL